MRQLFVPFRVTILRLRTEIAVCLVASIAVTGLTSVLAELLQFGAPEARAGWIGFIGFANLADVGVPIVAGLALGTSIIAPEFERGTAAFAWSVALDRRRWFGETIAAGAILVLLTGVPIAWASGVLDAAVRSQTFTSPVVGLMDPAPPLIVVRPLAAYAVAILVGLVLGRALPTLLVSLVTATVLLGVLEVGFAAVRDATAVAVDPSSDAVVVKLVAREPDGQIVSTDQAMADAAKQDPMPEPPYIPVWLGLSQDTRAEIVFTQAGATLLVAGLAVIAGANTLATRRPG